MLGSMTTALNWPRALALSVPRTARCTPALVGAGAVESTTAVGLSTAGAGPVGGAVTSAWEGDGNAETSTIVVATTAMMRRAMQRPFVDRVVHRED
ncbi:unannotated protein [freshwater metagenome]|uniref:Unannotated protein n=1 Tax=freshwater metagenome TaxID=449393 RepID=A0A6J7EN64_9ZZZZ